MPTFLQDLTLSADRLPRLVEDFRTELVDAVFAEIVEGGRYSPGTPVGETGRTKAAWTREDQPDRSVLQNPLAHVPRLEFGSSTQAPEGFIRLAVEAAPAMAQEIARQLIAEHQ